MHWDDLKDDDLIYVTSKDGGYAVNKKADLIKDEIKNKSSFLVKREYVEISIDEMRNIFIKKVFDIFKNENLLLKKMDADDMQSEEAIYRKIENIIKRSLFIDGFVKLKWIFNAIASDLNYFKKVDKIYFDKNEPTSGKRAAMITIDEDIVGIMYAVKKEIDDL